MSTQQPYDSSTDQQPTLATFGTGTTAVDNATSSSSRPDELELEVDTQQTNLTGEWTVEELRHLYENEGQYPAEIAVSIDADLSRSQVADRLRDAGVLTVYDDRDRLADLYPEYSTVEIAEQICDGEVTSETVAYRLHLFGLHEDSSQDLLAGLDPKELDLSPLTSDGPDSKRYCDK